MSKKKPKKLKGKSLPEETIPDRTEICLRLNSFKNLEVDFDQAFWLLVSKPKLHGQFTNFCKLIADGTMSADDVKIYVETGDDVDQDRIRISKITEEPESEASGGGEEKSEHY